MNQCSKFVYAFVCRLKNGYSKKLQRYDTKALHCISKELLLLCKTLGKQTVFKQLFMLILCILYNYKTTIYYSILHNVKRFYNTVQRKNIHRYKQPVKKILIYSQTADGSEIAYTKTT